MKRIPWMAHVNNGEIFKKMENVSLKGHFDITKDRAKQGLTYITVLPDFSYTSY